MCASRISVWLLTTNMCNFNHILLKGFICYKINKSFIFQLTKRRILEEIPSAETGTFTSSLRTSCYSYRRNFLKSAMHSLLSRGNALVAYTLTLLAILTSLCFLTTVFLDYSSSASINTVKVVVKNVPDYSASREKCDLGFLTFDLQANLTNVFNWNVKQLFLYLTAEYSSPKNSLSQVVLWDKIILRGENAVLDFKSMNPKYYFWDDGNGLRNNSHVVLTLSYNIIPNSGFLPNIAATGDHVFQFPSEYTVARV